MYLGIYTKIIKKREIALMAFFLLGIIFLYGAVPYFSTPTLGQAVWTTGFSQSFVNDSLFSVYAKNFGAPEPAAIAFGLSGAWVSAFFIWLGLHPADAYSAMIALWLSVAFCSAYRIGRYFGVPRLLAIFFASLWMSMPIIWAHSNYSMLSTGIALLSFYFLMTIKLFLREDVYGSRWVGAALPYFFCCVVAIFMDGYTFMMFAVGSSILAAWIILVDQRRRIALVKVAFPIHVLSFGLAYFLFFSYIGRSGFNAAELDFFRGWGVDLSFLIVPTQGVLWLPDLFGWSVSRSDRQWFGDASVWMTTFALPLMIAASLATWKLRVRRKFATGVILVALFGFYMALGPSLKIDSVKPVGQSIGPTMPAEYAIAPTGSFILSAYIPGFNNMRASYRWLALSIFCAWLLLIISISSSGRRIPVSIIFLSGIVMLFNLPDVPKKWAEVSNNRKMFFEIDRELVSALKKDVVVGERVAFLPWRNDFLVNYLAAETGIITYNIGGDKNLYQARLKWPDTISQFPMGKIDDGFSNRVLSLFAHNEVEVVVLPYVDMLWAAHRWPYPIEFKGALYSVLLRLKESGIVNVDEREYYAVVRLKPENKGSIGGMNFENLSMENRCLPPSCLESSHFTTDIFSQFGSFADGLVRSTGKRGFLAFGPYVPMNSGSYRLVVRGVSGIASSAYVDVVSKRGKYLHAKFPLISTRSANEVLVEGLVFIDQAVNDLEVRIFVGEQDEITLAGYILEPVGMNDGMVLPAEDGGTQ